MTNVGEWFARRGADVDPEALSHLGECEMRGEKVSGIEVHTAARIMAAADHGEILLSAAVRDALAAGEFAVRDRGRHELKGVPGERQLSAVAGA